jgi:hypothetical protein
MFSQVSWREEELDGWGHPISQRREGSGVHLWGFARLVRGPKPGLGQMGCPRPFTLFFVQLLFLFLFSISFVAFSKWFQIHSNQSR